MSFPLCPSQHASPCMRRISSHRSIKLHPASVPRPSHVLRASQNPDLSSSADGGSPPRADTPGAPAPPRFLPRMFHSAWQEAVQDAQRSSRQQPQSTEQQIQQLQNEVKQLMRGKGAASSGSSKGVSATSKGPNSVTQSSENGGSGGASAAAGGQVASGDDQLNGRGREADPAGAATAVHSRPLSRLPWVSWCMVAWTWLVFFKQWQPLIPVLLSRAPDPWEWLTRALALCLVIPDTPAAVSSQLNMLDFISGNWGSALPSAFLHSGLLPTMIFTRGLLQASTLLEESFGPGVVTLQALASALGAAFMQALLLPFALTITGPAVVCGLYAGLAVHVSRTRQLARLTEASASPPGAHVSGEADEGRHPAGAGSTQGAGSQGALSTHTGYVCFATALLLGLYQPMLSPWAVLGGVLGGVAAALCMPWVVAGMQGVLFYTLVAVQRVWGFCRSIPQLVLTSLIAVGRTLYLIVVELIKTVRQA